MDQRIEIIVAIDEAGERVDAFLRRKTELSRSRVSELILSGALSINGKEQLKPSYKVESGQCISLAVPDTQAVDIAPQNIPIDILYQDRDIVVINKPCGMVVHPAAGNEDGTLVNALMYHIRDLSGIGGEMRPGIVHRLDKDTSGLILVAKNDKAHIVMSEQFKSRTMETHYRAVAFGSFSQDTDLIDAPIARHPVDRKKMAVVPDGKPSQTEWRVIERLRGATYLDVHLLTGRTHQIRVHMQSVGHPLLGDKIYAPHIKTSVHVPRLMLHAYSLAFTHPVTGEHMELTAPIPEQFSTVLNKLR